MSNILRGIVASRGIVIGPAKLFVKEKVQVERIEIVDELVGREQTNLERAFIQYKKNLQADRPHSLTEQEMAQVHFELLDDPYFLGTALEKISRLKVTAEWAVQETIDEMVSTIDIIEDSYFRERAADYRNIGMNLLYILRGIQPDSLARLDRECIIISDELTPTDTSRMDKKRILGIANDWGGKTSHASIIAQTLGIPSLVGMRRATRVIKDGDLLILDAEHAQLIVNPSQEQLDSYRDLIARLEEEKDRLARIKDKKAVTLDGRELQVTCNIDGWEDVDLGLERGADGVGLFRTEFLFMKNHYFPSEEEQFQEYKKAVQAAEGKEVTIRTLDIGADKPLPYVDIPREENPFLGWRSLRISFAYPEIFDAQLRALLRASAFGKLKILLPLVISVEEILMVKNRIEALKKDLDAEGRAYDPNTELGIMIETPASVLLADDLIRHCDFFSIGTNDLTQYTLAVDRGNVKISGLYDTYHPAVLRSIKRVIEAGRRVGKPTAMCGGFAGDPDATYLLLGMGLDEFACPSSKVAKVKSILLQARKAEAEHFADRVMASSSLEQIHAMIRENPYR